MPSDRFGEIRIKPEQANIPPNPPDEETTGYPEERASRNIPDDKNDLPRTRRGTKESPHLPFIIGRVVLWTALPLFLVLLYGVGSYFLVPSLIKGPLAKNLSESFGRPVAVSRVIFSPFSLSVFLKDVSVGPVYGDMDKEDLIRCPEFSCRIDFLALFNRQIVCHEVRVNGIAVNLNRLQFVSFNIANATNFFSMIREKDGQVLWPAWLVLDGVQLTDGMIILNDSLAKKQHRIEQISFYLPSANEAKDRHEIMPVLNAVINSSPVQIDGRRQKNTRGTMETRFTLRFSDVVLKDYLEYIPSLKQNPFHLAEGQADVNVQFVIPELNSEESKVSVQLDAAIEALRFTNGSGRPLLKARTASLVVQAYPSLHSYNFQKIQLDDIECSLAASEQAGEDELGVSASEFYDFIQGIEQYPYGISVESLLINNATIEMQRGKQKSLRYTWENGELRLNGFSNRLARENNKVPPLAATFSISAREKKEEGAQLKVEGKMYPAEGFEGKFSLTSIDLYEYSPWLPEDVQFDRGRADIASSYRYWLAAGSNEKKQKTGLQLRGGELTLRDYVVQRNKKTVVAAAETVCRKMRVDGPSKLLSCRNISLTGGIVDGDLLTLGDLAGTQKENGRWNVRARNLDIRDTRLNIHVLNPFDREKPVFFALQNFSLHGENLYNPEHAESSLKASAVIGSKGTLLLNGTYSVASGLGNLQTTLQDISLADVSEYILPWFKPEIRNGTLTAAGTFDPGEKKFAGEITVRDLQSGQDAGPSLEWKEGKSLSLTVKLTPLSLQCQEMKVTKPRVSFGITHPEIPLQVFLEPNGWGEQGFQAAIQTIRFTEGVLDLPEPFLTKGYQPELTGLNGSIASVGADSMDFSGEGNIAEQASFTVQGTTGMDKISHYSLEVDHFDMTPFQALFSGTVGINVSNAAGAWRQEMGRADGNLHVSNRLHLQGIVPDPNSEYFKVTALYTDEEQSLDYSNEEVYRDGEEQILLFDSLFRALKQDAVRADLAPQLVLKKLLPELDLQDKVSFVPGAPTVLVTKDLADYEKLLGKRPFLRLELVGNYDPVEDAPELQKNLQQQEDIKREEENRRRSTEREKIEQQEKARLEGLKKNQQQVVEEKIPPAELSHDLQPLPYREVSIKPGMLSELARNRAEALARFFINGLLIPPERVIASPNTGETGPEVRITVLPYKPSP